MVWVLVRYPLNRKFRRIKSYWLPRFLQFDLKNGLLILTTAPNFNFQQNQLQEKYNLSSGRIEKHEYAKRNNMILVKLSDYQLLMQLPDMNTEHLLIKKFTIAVDWLDTVERNFFIRTLSLLVDKKLSKTQNTNSIISTHTTIITSKSKLYIPRLSICICCVGTWGDIQPFINIGRYLKESNNHQIAIITHRCYKDRIEDIGFEFKSLNGDPALLAKTMVETKGNPLGIASIRSLRSNIKMVEIMMISTMNALKSLSFCPHVLIANPICYGIQDIAERFDIHLHYMFPQPWLRTKAFPQTFFMDSHSNSNSNSNSNYISNATVSIGANTSTGPSTGASTGAGVGTNEGWSWSSIENRLSYDIYEKGVWLTMQHIFKNFRVRHLQLPPQRFTRNSTATRNNKIFMKSTEIPFSILCSKILLPKPVDWPVEASVVGYAGMPYQVGMNTKSSKKNMNNYDGLTSDLLEFLSYKNKSKPVYVGFGSMIIERRTSLRLLESIIIGFARAGVRLVVQASSGWCIDEKDFRTALVNAENKVHAMKSFWSPSDAFLIKCGEFINHTTLFLHCSACIHHGGSGSTHTSLTAGIPVWIIPFFGDQHLFGRRIYVKSLGPSPCVVENVTDNRVLDSLQVLFSSVVVKNAFHVGRQLRGIKENGIINAVQHFHECLPLHQMLCQVCLMLNDDDRNQLTKYYGYDNDDDDSGGGVELSQVYCVECKLFMSRFVAKVVHERLDSDHTVHITSLHSERSGGSGGRRSINPKMSNIIMIAYQNAVKAKRVYNTLLNINDSDGNETGSLVSLIEDLNHSSNKPFSLPVCEALVRTLKRRKTLSFLEFINYIYTGDKMV